MEPLPVYSKPDKDKVIQDNRSINQLLSAFGMSESSSKQYADVDGTAMFIDANATLRFYEGAECPVLEYSAAGSRGKALSTGESSTDTLYGTICGAYSLAYSVKELFEMEELSLVIASDVTSFANSGETVLYLDYCINGNPVYFAPEGLAVHGAEVRFNSSGNLVYYRQNLFDVKETLSKVSYPSVMSAIDKVYSENTGASVFVEDIFKSYRLGGGSVSATWGVRIKNDSNVYVIE
jgi:hypothetical protein